MTDQQKWDEAEANMIQLEETDTVFYGVSVERLREIRGMALQSYWSLTELEKHYWIFTMERHGHNADKLLKCIALLEKEEIEKRLNSQINIVVDALKKTSVKPSKKEADNMPDIANMTYYEKGWLALRTTPKKERQYKTPVYPSQRELADIMGVDVMKLNRLEKRMEARADIKRYFAVLGISGRKARGATVTKRKKV